MPKPMYVWTGTAWVSVASEVESLATYATQSYADNQPGMKMVVPSSVAVGSGSGSVSTQGAVTFSGASSVSLNDVFSTTYDNYKILIDTTGSTSIYPTLRLRVSGADNSTSNYQRQYASFVNATSYVGRATNQTSWNTEIEITSGNRTFAIIDIFNPFATKVTGAYISVSANYNATNIYLSHSSLGFNATTSFTGFSFIPDTGNVTGTISVYGYKKG